MAWGGCPSARWRTMTEGVLLRVCRAQASLAETLVEPWLREHDAAARAHLIGSMLPPLIALCDVFQELHAAGKQVFTWTVNSERVMHRAAELGVDGVLSDDPILLARTLGRNRISHDTSSSETISIGD